MNEMFPSKWLAASDLEELGGDVDMTISDCTLETVGQGERKWVLWFKDAPRNDDGTTKGLILNVTRTKTISQVLLSDDTDDWSGKRITLYPTETMYNKEMVPTIGVRKKLPRAAKPQPATAARTAGKAAPPVTQEEADEPDDDPPF